MLVSGGGAYISIKKGVGEKIVKETHYGQKYSRFFSYFLEDEFSLLCKTVGFTVKKVRLDHDRIEYIVEK